MPRNKKNNKAVAVEESIETKKEAKPEDKAKADFADNEEVIIVGIEGAKHLKAGEQYKVIGITAKSLISKGYARLATLKELK